MILSTTSKNAPLLIYNRFSYIMDRRTDKKILWKCEFSRKFQCHERLHIDLSNKFIQTVGVTMRITLVIDDLDRLDNIIIDYE